MTRLETLMPALPVWQSPHHPHWIWSNEAPSISIQLSERLAKIFMVEEPDAKVPMVTWCSSATPFPNINKKHWSNWGKFGRRQFFFGEEVESDGVGGCEKKYYIVLDAGHSLREGFAEHFCRCFQSRQVVTAPELLTVMQRKLGNWMIFHREAFLLLWYFFKFSAAISLISLLYNSIIFHQSTYNTCIYM